jgi:hypothetical protein
MKPSPPATSKVEVHLNKTPNWLRHYRKFLNLVDQLSEYPDDAVQNRCPQCGKTLTARHVHTLTECKHAQIRRQVFIDRYQHNQCPLCGFDDDLHDPNCRLGKAIADLWTCQICQEEVDLWGVNALMPTFDEEDRLTHTGCRIANQKDLDLLEINKPQNRNFIYNKDRLTTWAYRYLIFRQRLTNFGFDPDSPPQVDLEALKSLPFGVCWACQAPVDLRDDPRRRFCSNHCCAKFQVMALLAHQTCPVCCFRGGIHSTVCRLKLALRDRWTCWLCHETVSPLGTGTRAPSFDHVLPKLYHGKNTAENLKLAHALCNGRRGAPPPDTINLELSPPDYWSPAIFEEPGVN